MHGHDPLFLAIDVGTGGVRAGIVDVAGRLSASRSIEHRARVVCPGWSEQRPARWWEAVVTVVGELVAETGVDARRIAAIGVCGQMHAPVPIGPDGAPLLDWVQLWNDKRAADLVHAFADAQALAARVANPAAPAWIAFKIAWIRDHQPDAYAQARVFLTPKDFINYRLTGEIVTDFSEASGSWLLDWRTRRYDPAIASALGIDVAKFPAPHPSAAVIGTVTREAAAATGLASGIPVIAGAGDFPAALVGSGVITPGTASDITGTSTLISILLDAPIPDRRIMNLHAAGDGWIGFAMNDAGGDCMRWVRRVIGAPETTFEDMNALAAEVPAGADGLLFLPYLSGERLSGLETVRGQFFGIGSEHEKGHFFRAVMEGSAFASRRNMEIMRRAGARPDRLVAAGGGARSPLWLKIKASTYGCHIAVPENTETGLVGCAALCAVATGHAATLSDAVAAMVRYREEVAPDPELSDLYARRFADFVAVCDHNETLARLLSGMPIASPE